MRIENHGMSALVSAGPTQMRERLETAFLSEMLNIAMPAQGDSPFGGGSGESQFASFLNEQYAGALAARLDLGLTAKLDVPHG